MRWLRKLNKGVVLTTIVLIVLIIYLISVEAKRNSEKPNIETACKEYIELINKYVVLPEQNQKVYNTAELNEEDQVKKQEELNLAITLHTDKLRKELTTKMINNDMSIDMQRDRVEDFIKNGNNIFSSVITKFDKEITKINKFVFDDNQVTVTFSSKIDGETKSLNAEGKDVSKINNYEASQETITLQNVDGKWKVVYADLQYGNDSSAVYQNGVTVSF